MGICGVKQVSTDATGGNSAIELEAYDQKSTYHNTRRSENDNKISIDQTDGPVHVSDSDFNEYARKKTMAKGLLDIGLLTANASQLRTLFSLGPSHDFYYAAIILIGLSIILQIVVGILLLILGREECNENSACCKDNRNIAINNVTVGMMFAIVVVNILIASFNGVKEPGGANPWNNGVNLPLFQQNITGYPH